MDHREELRREMLGTFHAELDEHLATASRVLLALEEKPGADETKQLVIEVLRVAHSLKGVARVVDVSDIERIFHAMEDILTLVRDRGILLQRPHYDAFFATLDMARSVMDAHMAGQVFSPSGVQKLVDQLKGLPVTSEEQASPEPEVQLPKPPPATTPTSGSPDVGETAADFSADDQPAPESATDEALPRPRAIVADETIRMSTGKLDALMASVGQLLVSRMRIEQRLTELREFQSGIAKRDKEWRKVKRTITRSRRSSSNRSAQAVPMSLQEANPISEFLVSNEQHMEEALDDLSQLVRSFDADYAYLTLLTDDLQDVVRRIRMLPIASLFDRFPRMVRDLSQGLGKEIGLVVEGEDTEVDRQVMELIADPLTHLLRNAVSHGIEGKDERLKSNKPERGEIVLRALQRGNNIVVEVEDDGGGIRLDEVKRKAVQRGLLSATDASHLSERGTLELIFHSGLTTVSEVSDISGRGVGLDVVRENLEKLGGQISVTTSAANGTTFTLTLPLTMTTSHVLLVEVAGQTVAVPTTTVLRILRVAPSEIGTLEGHHVIRLDDRPIPLLSLNEVLELGEGRLTFSEYEKVQIVVACRSVGSDTGTDPRFKKLRHRRHPDGQLHIAPRRMGDLCAPICNGHDVRGIHPHGMDQQRVCVQDPDPIQVLHRTQAVFF